MKFLFNIDRDLEYAVFLELLEMNFSVEDVERAMSSKVVDLQDTISVDLFDKIA